MDIDYNEKDWATPCPKYDCRKTACKCGLEYVNIPASLGDDSEDSKVAPKNGAYCNALVVYEANGHVYIYSKEGVPTLIDVDASDISTLEQEVRKAQKDVHELREEIDGVIYGFDTVADMKQATNLINGSYARTLGFHTLNDGGGALYKITNSGTANEMDVIAIGSLYATLTKNDSYDLRQFGAYGDGTTDDTTYIQEALDFVSSQKQELTISEGTYMVDASTGVLPKSNTTITFSNGKLKAIPNNLEHSQVVKFDRVENIVINDCVIVGERDEHIGTTGEWGHCIYFIGSCKNITFNNADLSNAWGDGIEMFAQNEDNVWKYPTNIYFNGMTYIHHCGRQGVSIIAGEHIYFDTLYCKGIDRTPPCAAIDIETEGITWYIGNIHINYLKSEDTSKAFSLRNKGGITGDITVDRIDHINPHYEMDNPSAMQYISPVTIFFDYYTTDSAKYSINIGDIFTDYGTFLVQNAYIGATPTVHISNIFSKKVQAISSADVNRFRSVFYIYYDKQCSLSSKLGGIYVDNIVVNNMIERDGNNLSARYYSVYYNFDDNASKTFENCVINCTLVNHEANINFTGAPMPTSNVVFNNVDIKVNIPPQNIRSASNSDTTKIVGGLTDIYFTPTDSTGTNRRLVLRPTDAFIGSKIYAKGNTTLKINLAYNSTHFTGVYENGNPITIDGSNNYVVTNQTSNSLYNITTDDKNIYVEVI